MKKTAKRLYLSKETLRSLESAEDLRAVFGGAEASGDGEFRSRCSECAPNTWTCKPAV
jgi:hypothetical protein